ncbi:MAG: sigma-70 family RNA polymerase sigma factor [Candidatus Zixiibacteriota bacterium]
MDEKELIGKAKSGDFEAFMRLVDAHKDKVYGMIRRLAGNSQDAEDVMQDSLLQAIDKIDQFKGESSFGTWLYSIALNMVRAEFAKRKQVDLKPIEEYLPKTTDGHSHDHADTKLFDWKDPLKLMESKQLGKLIDTVIDELPFKYREVFLLRNVEEFSIKEIARLIKQSEASAKSRILRARLAMRDKLSKELEAENGRKLS